MAPIAKATIVPYGTTTASAAYRRNAPILWLWRAIWYCSLYTLICATTTPCAAYYVSLTITCYAGPQVPAVLHIAGPYAFPYCIAPRHSVLHCKARRVNAMTEKRQYRVFLLRLWQADGDGAALIWRAALEDARTGERRGFADLAR